MNAHGIVFEAAAESLFIHAFVSEASYYTCERETESLSQQPEVLMPTFRLNLGDRISVPLSPYVSPDIANWRRWVNAHGIVFEATMKCHDVWHRYSRQGQPHHGTVFLPPYNHVHISLGYQFVYNERFRSRFQPWPEARKRKETREDASDYTRSGSPGFLHIP